ncbi:MAG: hypothetical protein K6G53_07270 [Bacteroidales bacterium]|nr:hypothetical protein [Bacteroidales bacterium]
MKKMKTMNALVLLCVLCVSIVACNSKMETEPEFTAKDNLFDKGGYDYSISVSFIDKEGNDLVAPLAAERYIKNSRGNNWEGEINPDKYSLEITLSKPNADFKRYHSPQPIYDNSGPYFWISKHDGEVNYLSNGFSHFRYQYVDDDYDKVVENPRQEYVKYIITCPTVFNDSAAHELVVYWDNSNTQGKWIEMKCIKALFEGKECEVCNQEFDGIYENIIKVVLDK